MTQLVKLTTSNNLFIIELLTPENRFTIDFITQLNKTLDEIIANRKYGLFYFIYR